MGNGLGMMLGGGVAGSNYFFSSVWGSLGVIGGDAAGDEFGKSVSLSSDGTIVAIGAVGNDDNGSNSGQVQVYQNVAGTWIQVGADIDGEAAGDISGISVSLSNDGLTLAIGAYGNDGNGTGWGTGHARVYQYSGGSWTQIGSDIDGEAEIDWSGWSVSLSGDATTVAIGAPFNDGIYASPFGGNPGHVRVYENVGGTWTIMGNEIDGYFSGARSGWSVSLSDDGTIVAIGAVHAAYVAGGVAYFYAGMTRVYQYAGGAWSQIGSDINGEAADDESGISVSLSADGTTVAIGAPYNDGNGADAGHVRVYLYDGSSWNQIGQDIDGEAAGDVSSNVSLSTDGLTLAIGAGGNDGAGANAGHVRVYQYNGTSWSKIGSDINGEAAGDVSGASISLSADGSILAVGSPGNDENGINAGKVHIYTLINN